MSKGEWDRIEAKIGKIPDIGEDLTCPLFDKETGKCTVYEVRPLVCRLFGMVKKMKCKYGCKPSKWLSDRKAFKLMDEMLVKCGPQIGTVPDEVLKLVRDAGLRLGG
jgi:Fe-S-cluster containining protein